MSRESWQKVRDRKQAERDALIPPAWRLSVLPSPEVLDVRDVPRTCQLLSPQELDITESYDATALAEVVRLRKLTCIEVTRAFCKRAAIAQQLTNCLTEILFERALARAAYLDHYLNLHGKPVGPLHGVPISLKDSFRVAGVDSSIGIAALAFNPSKSTSPLVSILLSAGAIIYCKTNVPQTLMALDSDNNLFGRTLNPANRRVTAGGSSGGEGALIAMRGSVLGIGTDIGGSIRIPAMCNGIYGLKPSHGRVPYGGQESGSLPGSNALTIQSCAGPLACSLRDCSLLLNVVAAAKPWECDAAIIPGLWASMDQSLSSLSSNVKPMTIGILHTDGVTTPLPPIQRLLREVSDTLSTTGIRTVDIVSPPALRDAQRLVLELMELEGGNSMFDLIEAFAEPLTAWLAPRVRRKKPRSLHQAAALHARREVMMNEMLALWRLPDGSEVDALICPVAPHPVPPLDSWGAVGYTADWVLLDCPAGVVPVRKFEERDMEGEVPETEPLGSWDHRNRELWNSEKIDRRIYLGTPLSVQVVAPRLQEKRLYRAMEVIDQAIRESKTRARSSRL